MKKKSQQFTTESKINDLHEIGRVFKLVADEFRTMLKTGDRRIIKNIALNFDKLSTLCQKINLPPKPDETEGDEQMNNWKKTCMFIDSNKLFTSIQITDLGVPKINAEQYRHYLKKAGFIECLGGPNFRRLKEIGELSIYKVKEIALDLEDEKAALL